MTDLIKDSSPTEEVKTEAKPDGVRQHCIRQHFIRQLIAADFDQSKENPEKALKQLVTRFPPEPNGYLHLGHAKSICLNFGLAEEFDGVCHLRFDDTNPEKESEAYIQAIQKDVRWLGYQWYGKVRFASDYFEALYELACELIRQEKAYVCELTSEEMRTYRGTLTEPGKESPYRNRSAAENLALFEKMKAGELAEGSCVLRAKIDMASPNLNMRDPILYRIRFVTHHQTGDLWCVYPMYDFTHCLSDAEEGITHSLCTLEFEDHRPLYDWVLNQFAYYPRPQQIEFARLNINYAVTSKRKLKQLIDEGFVSGWDDPRMLTISGLRRRGVTPEAIQAFCQEIGVSKAVSVVDMGMLEHCIRQDLDDRVPRAMCVFKPLKVILTNFSEAGAFSEGNLAEETQWLELAKHPKAALGERAVPLTREIWIDRDDFMLVPEKKYFRLSPGKEVRLRGAYVIRCDKVIQDESTGEVLALECAYDPATLGKKPEGRKVKGVIHWVSAEHAKPCTVKLYDRLFTVDNPEQQANQSGAAFTQYVNPDSCEVISGALIESSVSPEVQDFLANGLATEFSALRYQFERMGYFSLDLIDSSQDHWVFNRTVTLKDTWAKLIQQSV